MKSLYKLRMKFLLLIVLAANYIMHTECKTINHASLSSAQIKNIKRILKLKCIRRHGRFARRFCSMQLYLALVPRSMIIMKNALLSLKHPKRFQINVSARYSRIRFSRSLSCPEFLHFSRVLWKRRVVRIPRK